MKKLIIASVALLTTVGISAYTKDNSQPANQLNISQNAANATQLSGKSSSNLLIPKEVGRYNLAQAD